jgi:hypothetical protein
MDDKLQQVGKHYRMWTEDADTRRTRPNGQNAVTDAYWGKLPSDWPYTSKVVDPCIRTSLTEKNARLLNAKLRGRLVPREGGDVLKARINNALLDFQWDNANFGGSMLAKYATMDMDTRLYGSKFALVLWRHEEKDKKVLFDGNEFYPLDLRDCGIDPTATHIRDAKWFQYRDWVKVEDLKNIQDSPSGKKYPGLDKLIKKIEESGSQNRKDNAYASRVLENKGLTNRTGEDKAFPVVERVREFRKDRWICYFPKYNVIGYDIKNPYEHGQIPVVQLRYYPLGDDPIGESEVEPVLSLWRAICATLCGYLDNMNIHMRPPLKVLPGANVETLIFGAEALWQMSNPGDVTEFQSNGEAMRYFQTTYSALKAAFNTAMGDMSQGISGIDPFSPDKTATEVKQTVRQQNVRDQSNQMYLGECISDMMMMWLVNNRQFLFLDSEKHEYILRIIGTDLYEYFKRAGLDEMEVTPEAMGTIAEIIQAQEGNLSDSDVQQLYETAKTPKFPVYENPKEKNPEKIRAYPKMRMNDMNDGAEVSVLPEDLDGSYDYIATTKSMQAGAEDVLIQAQQQAINTLKDPAMLQLLAGQGIKPMIKELLVDSFNNSGLQDAEKYFEKIQQAPVGQGVVELGGGQNGQIGQNQIGIGGGDGLQQPLPQQGVPNTPPSPIGQGQPAGMA